MLEAVRGAQWRHFFLACVFLAMAAPGAVADSLEGTWCGGKWGDGSPGRFIVVQKTLLEGTINDGVEILPYKQIDDRTIAWEVKSPPNPDAPDQWFRAEHWITKSSPNAAMWTTRSTFGTGAEIKGDPQPLKPCN